jgi:hypothetical protein
MIKLLKIILLSILIVACSSKDITFDRQLVIPLPEPSISCNEVEAFADIMFGEGENQSYEAKLDLARFLYSESLKYDRDVCDELHSRKPGGALKYSSVHGSLDIRKSKNKKYYEEVLKMAEKEIHNIKLTFNKISEYNHYITINLAKNRPPKWFKQYIVSYYISGDHVFANLDFKIYSDEQYKDLLLKINNKK